MKLSPWAAAIGFLLAVFVSSLQATTDTWPALMNFQGQLTNAGGTLAVTNGTYSMVFAIYGSPTGGTPSSGALWTETQSVTVNSGLFDVILGTVNPLTNLNLSNFGTDLWVGVTVGSDAEMTPRQQLLPASYARNALSLNGLLANNQANNLVVLNSSGQVPASEIQVQDGAVAAPLDLSSSSATYILNLASSSSSVSALGLTVTASNGVNAQATSSAGYGVWGQTATSDGTSAVGLRGSAGAGTGVLAQSVSGAGLSATTQSNSGGSAGFFQALGTTGLNSAVRAESYSQNGANYFSDATNFPLYGLYHYDDSSGGNSRYGVYALENCSTCYAGYFTNVGTLTQDGSALTVNGRLQLVGGSNASSGYLTVTANTTSENFSNPYVPADGSCLVFLTPVTPVNVVAAVTAKGSGTFTVTLSAPQLNPVEYEYWIVGQ